VGFGVRTPEQAAAIARVADGVVVGSAWSTSSAHGTERARPLAASCDRRALADAVHAAR
jgi:tryptophan synthase alpha chain